MKIDKWGEQVIEKWQETLAPLLAHATMSELERKV